MAIDSIKRKKGTAWRARLVLKNRQRISKCFERKIDAVTWEAQQITEDGDATKIRREPIRFEELTEQFLKYLKAESQYATFEKYEGVIRLYLNPQFGKVLMDEIRKKDIMDFKIKVSEFELASATKSFIFSALKTILRKGVELELVGVDPSAGVKSPRKGESRTEYWATHEIQRFLNSMNGHPRFPLYLIALNTGMRAGEIFGLKWDCVDFENDLIHVRRTMDQKTQIVKETTKTHCSRVLGMSAALQKVLIELAQKSASEFVVDKDSMGCSDITHVARAFKGDCERVGVRPINFHDLRHTFATELVRKTGDIQGAARVLGHKSVSMTERYAHFGPEHAAQAAKLVNFGAESGAEVIPIRA